MPQQRVTHRSASNPALKRHHTVPHGHEGRANGANDVVGPVSSRTRRAAHRQGAPNAYYETPDEEDELLDEALASAHRAATRLDRHSNRNSGVAHSDSTRPAQRPAPYLTPSPSANRDGVNFGLGHDMTPTKPLDIAKPRGDKGPMNQAWPTPPYEENEWAAAAAASIFAAQAAYR